MAFVLVHLCDTLEEFVEWAGKAQTGQPRLLVVQSVRPGADDEDRVGHPIARVVLTGVVNENPPRLLRYSREADLPSRKSAVEFGRAFAIEVIEKGLSPESGEWRIEEVARTAPAAGPVLRHVAEG